MLINNQKFDNIKSPGGFCEMFFLLKPYVDINPLLKDINISFSGSSYNNEYDIIKITMWETTKLKLSEVKLMNRCRVIFVPSRALMYIFSASGVTRPIEVFDPFIDDCYIHKSHIKKDKLIIGMAYNMNFTRKNQHFGIECFKEAFQENDDVELWIKTNEKFGEVDKKIKVFNTLMSKQELIDWYEQVDVVLSTARAEGIGLFNLQSMACGRPIVSNDFLTISDYANEENSFIIPHSLIMPTDNIFGRCGLWSDMKKEDVIDRLRYVYNNRSLIYQKSNILKNQMNKYKASTSVPKLIKQIEKYV